MNGGVLSIIKSKLQQRKQGILGGEQDIQTAVLLPLIEREDELHVLFEVRSLKLKRQPGEICFPGGKQDESDVSPLETAVRETAEELGIDYDDIEVLGPLDVLVTPFRTIVYPYVGLIRKDTSLYPNDQEVEKIFTVPLSYLKNHTPEKHELQITIETEQDFPFHLIHNGKEYKWRLGTVPEYFYSYENYVIWGLTARILHHFTTQIVGDES